MKLLLALALAGVVAAHWTHDDSLAREIGAPPGEEDMDVAALSDELISESESELKTTTYRITIGTAWKPGIDEPAKQYMWYNGGSAQPIKFMIKGQKGWGDSKEAKGDGSFKTLRYYVGPFMDYDMAGDVAPALLPGLVPLLTVVNGVNIPCFGLDSSLKGGRVKDCNKKVEGGGATEKMDWCEPNSKACKSKLSLCEDKPYNQKCPGIGYARPPPTMLRDGVSETASFLKVGLIQRGQIDYEDVGDIVEVQAKSKPVNSCPPPNSDMTDWECSSPWYPQFIKVNSNKATSGIGNGIYYIHPMEGLHTGIVKSTQDPPALSEDMFIVAKPGPVPDDVTIMKMDGSHNAELKKCVAQHCEEEMDALFGLSAEMMQQKS